MLFYCEHKTVRVGWVSFEIKIVKDTIHNIPYVDANVKVNQMQMNEKE